MSSPFDPDSFLDATVNESMSTQMVPVPVGEYPAVIDAVEMKPWNSLTKGTSGMKAVITWSIDDESVKSLLAREKVTVRQDLMLDLTESGGLDVSKGRNVGLGRLRDALGMNKPGEPFSFRQLQGRTAKVKVEHRTHDDAIYAEIKGVARM